MTSLDDSDFPLLSLFSGAGGLDYGFKAAGFRTVLAIDINQAALDYIRNQSPRLDSNPIGSLASRAGSGCGRLGGNTREA